LRNHPLVKNIGKVKNAYIIGSFAENKQNEYSDLDVLIEIQPIKNYTATEFTEKKRNLIRVYFVKHNIWGPDDSVHPQWNGRRIDIYFTYDASKETRPKILLQ
jgi:predicted nucleotidyltransferase